MKKIKEIARKIARKMFGIDSFLFIPQIAYKEADEVLNVSQDFLDIF